MQGLPSNYQWHAEAETLKFNKFKVTAYKKIYHFVKFMTQDTALCLDFCVNHINNLVIIDTKIRTIKKQHLE